MTLAPYAPPKRGWHWLLAPASLFPVLLCSILSVRGDDAAAVQLGKGVAEHVVVVVWDGMRRDFITPQYTPVLYDLTQRGVFFKSHHPVYISSTEVNGTAIATGSYPIRSG